MPEKRKTRIGPLDSVAAVRRELGRVYRKARNGDIDTADLRAFVYCLRELRESLVASDLEARIESLEAQ